MLYDSLHKKKKLPKIIRRNFYSVVLEDKNILKRNFSIK